MLMHRYTTLHPGAAPAVSAGVVRSTLCATPLTSAERACINAGVWFAGLSPSLRHDIIRCASVRRYQHGEAIAAQADTGSPWIACAKGRLRVGATTARGRWLTWDYVEPGQWLGDEGMLDDEPRTHDLHAHGDSTTLQITRRDFMALFYAHVEFRAALLHQQQHRARVLYDKIEDLKTLGLGARLAKTLLEMSEQHGAPDTDGRQAGLQLPQRQLADWVGASRQRVNEHLKRMETLQIIRQEDGAVVVQDRATLARLAQLA